MTMPSSVTGAMQGPTGRKPQHLTPGRIGLYLFLVIAALFFLLPLYVMLVTSFKSMPEIRQGNIFAFPQMWTADAWVQAWSTACTGLECGGISVGFWNSVKILIPSMILSILISSLTGYALSFWRVRGANVLFAILLLGAFIPYQVFIYPLVLIYRDVGIYSTLPCIIITHTVFGLPVLTLLFRNYYSSLPMELFKAARIDGAGLWQIFFRLNNIVNSTQGEKLYNVNMAATILTALVPLIVYFGSGRWFVRGITAGAVKG